MSIVPHDPDADTPSGWQIVTLRGGPHDRQRFTLHKSDDRFELLDEDGRPQPYYRTNDRAELYHESLIGKAFGSNRGGV
jgi:hypothetical protein